MVGEIRIENVSKSFLNADGTVLNALNEVNLSVQPGSFISLIGPSGCGKTTLLRAIAGLNLADKGSVYLDGVPVKKPGHERGFAFQQANLYPWLSIEKNIAFGLKARGIYKVLLLDEPLGALDAFTRMNMQDEIMRIWKEQKMTMIMVTHDVDEAVYLSDQVVIMTPRPAKIEQVIDIELGRPRSRGSNDFLKYRTKILEILNYAGENREPEYYL